MGGELSSLLVEEHLKKSVNYRSENSLGSQYHERISKHSVVPVRSRE